MTNRARRVFGKLRAARVFALNSLVGLRPRVPAPESGHPAFAEVVEKARTHTDICDHLVTIFVEALAARPRLMVELGVRGGESTFVMERVAAVQDARLVSVDVEDCSSVSQHEKAVFVQADDVEFGKRFADWCGRVELEPRVDALFIDTTHEYEHTVREIEEWFPHLAPRATVIFHDTNLVGVYRRSTLPHVLRPHGSQTCFPLRIRRMDSTPSGSRARALSSDWDVTHLTDRVSRAGSRRIA